MKWSEADTAAVRVSYQSESWRTMECLLSISRSSCLPCHHHASVQLVPKYIKSESHHYQSTIPKDLSVINIWVLLPTSHHHASVQLVRKYIKKKWKWKSSLSIHHPQKLVCCQYLGPPASQSTPCFCSTGPQIYKKWKWKSSLSIHHPQKLVCCHYLGPPAAPVTTILSSVQLVPKYRSKLEVMFIIVIPKDFIASIKGFLKRKIPPIIWKVWRALRLWQ